MYKEKLNQYKIVSETKNTKRKINQHMRKDCKKLKDLTEAWLSEGEQFHRNTAVKKVMDLEETWLSVDEQSHRNMAVCK